MSTSYHNPRLVLPVNFLGERRGPITDIPELTLRLVPKKDNLVTSVLLADLQFISFLASLDRYLSMYEKGIYPVDMSDSERGSRDGDQWILSVIAYLEWREGKSWRKIHRLLERWNPLRWHYLHPQRLLKELRYAPVAECQCAKFCALPKKPMMNALPHKAMGKRA